MGGVAAETFQALIEQFNFYGQLAREDLGMKIHVPKRVIPDESLVKQNRVTFDFRKRLNFSPLGGPPL